MAEADQVAIIAAIMAEDISDDLKLKEVTCNGECVVTEENLVFYKTRVTDENDRTEIFWIANSGPGDDDFLLEDDQPEGIHIPAFGV